jgi:hypothetical protein
MPRANLKGQLEVEYLKQAVRQIYENQANRMLVVNTNKSNYARLAEEISAVAQKLAQGTRLEKLNLNVSDGQVRSLFMESNKDFLDYFVEACYLYTQGTGREEFLSLAENADLIQSWETTRKEQTELIFDPTTHADYQNLQTEKEILSEKLQKQSKILRGGILALAALGIAFFLNYQSKQAQIRQKQWQLERLNVWTNNKGNVEAEELRTYVDFLDAQSGFFQVIDSIIWALETPSVFAEIDNTLPIVHYKNVVTTGGYRKYGNTFFPDQISLIPFHGYNDLKFDSAKVKMQGVAAYLYRLYSQITQKDGGTYLEKDILAKIMRLDKTVFDVDLIYLGYKKDVDNPNSDDFMLRYPPYRYDEGGLQDYVMVNRQWWKEALNKTGIHWRQMLNKQTRECGITKPYPTVRVDAPNQRTFWVEIKDSKNPKSEMVLAVDLILKE